MSKASITNVGNNLRYNSLIDSSHCQAGDDCYTSLAKVSYFIYYLILSVWIMTPTKGGSSMEMLT